MAKVTIVFDGAIAVGPPAPESGDGEGPFFGIMPRSAHGLSHRTQRLRRETPTTGEESQTVEDQYLALHVPTIFTRMAPAAGSRPPDQILQLSPFHERWYIWHPLRERLEFRFDNSSETGPLEYLRDDSAIYRHSRLPEGSLSFHGFGDVPDMETIWPERNVLLPGLLSAGSGVSDKVMTQVLVPRGTVMGAALLRRPPSEDAAFDPPRASTGRKLVPNTAVIVDDVASVDIATFSLDSGQELDSIKLEMADGGEIWVSNGDPSDVEVDMEKLSMQIIDRSMRHDRWKPSLAAQEILNRFATTFRRSGADLAREIVDYHHHSRNLVLDGLAVELHRTGDHDLDFELFYSLLREDHLAHDGVGLPVPRCRPRVAVEGRPIDADQGGPDCFNCGCKTSDRVFMRSGKPVVPGGLST